MKKVKKQMLNVVLFTLLFVIIACVTIGTYAWFTDQKSFSTNELKFGTITLNVTGDSISGENLNVVVTRSVGDLTGQLMPGDTVSLKFNVTLNTGCEPAYYLVSLAGAENLFDESCFYYDSTTKTVVSPTTESPTVGSLTAGTTHTFNLTKQISTDYETQGESVSITLEVYAIQQANLTVTEAYGKLTGTTIPVYTRVTENGKDYIYFGSYPQTVANVTGLTLTESETVTCNYGNISTYTKYTDSDGNEYVKITAKPYSASYTYSNGTPVTATETYFKVEPLKWRILSENADGTALIVCDQAIKAMACGSNDEFYKDRKLRAYLTGDFYNRTFTVDEKASIKLTKIQNIRINYDDETEGYNEGNTSDYIFALSYQDMTNSNYGFSTSTSASTTRMFNCTDYSIANYAQVSGIDESNRAGDVWTRTGTEGRDPEDMWAVYGEGDLYGGANAYKNCYCALPALNIIL